VSRLVLRGRRRAALRRAAVLLLLSFAAWHGVQSLWIVAKARVAQQLIRRAWVAAQAGRSEPRPWPWADTRPVARLCVPARGLELFVLDGASGRTLAFGPGHVDGTALPGQPGNAVVGGHRDTHFAFLRELKAGDAIVVERADGRQRRYLVSGARIVDRGDTSVTADAGDTRLTLVTCFPFDAIRPGGPLRYVVTALAEPATEAPDARVAALKPPGA
jgi:sortase A